MYTRDRIKRLLTFTGLSPAETVTDTLDMIDTVMNVDTATIPSLECTCLWHIGKACSARRQVGARLALLEECMAREEAEEKITKEIKDLQEQYAYG